MSQDNVEIVQRLYEALARDEFPVEVIDPEIEYVNPAGAIEPGTRHGAAEFRRAVEKVFEGWATWNMEPEQFTAVGNQVAVVVQYRARGRTSGVQLEGRESALVTLKEGKVVRYEWFHEPDDALRAAESRESAMSQKNVEVVRHMNDAFNRGDASWVDLFDTGVEFLTPPEFPDDAMFTGRDGIRRGADLWSENFSEYRWDAERLIDVNGDCVVGLYHHRGRIKDGGAWVERPVGAVYYLRDGMIVRVLSYFSWVEALKAVGMGE